MSKYLNDQLNQIRQVELDLMNIDFKEERIRIQGAEAGDHEKRFDLVFEGVNAFFYSDPSEMEAAIPGRRSTMKTVAYQHDGFGEFAVVHRHEEVDDADFLNLESNISVPNFNIEFDDATLFIEAEGITINDRRYTLTKQS
ncbi:YxiG family protein [Acidaminobacter hydrogenoformans]|uniref:Uncharacterized protein n=1 Tax=Acidaminobacter hydrogenoformans DSM 2784 TaxID=1120920 RepID=A0A1G5RZC9_9FIRM|nr:hypothetical protein [Acidaminobacter hydrogenoformans]SCZ79208.1 hypothetical protein SAMN03080599_01647 [Acidaminobacter hydrogenoformans DSM 2784]